MVSPRIDARFAQCEAPVLGDHRVHFNKVVIAVARHLWHFEYQDVDDSC